MRGLFRSATPARRTKADVTRMPDRVPPCGRERTATPAAARHASFQNGTAPGPVRLRTHYVFLRGKKPLCFAVDACKAPLSPNGHGPAGRLSGRLSAGGPRLFAAVQEKAFSSFFPPSPHSFPSTLLRKRVRGTGQPGAKDKWSVSSLFTLFIEIIV